MDALEDILIGLFELRREQLHDGLTPQDVALWDSLNNLRLITAVEERFGVRFSMAEIESIDSLGRLRALLAEHGA